MPTSSWLSSPLTFSNQHHHQYTAASCPQSDHLSTVIDAYLIAGLIEHHTRRWLGLRSDAPDSTMRTSTFLAPLFFAASSLAQGVDEGIEPDASAPAGCTRDVKGNFTIGVENFFTPKSKRESAQEVRPSLTTLRAHTDNDCEGRRWSTDVHTERWCPTRSIQPHRLHCSQPAVPVRRAPTSRRNLHRRILSVQEQLAGDRWLRQVVAVHERQFWQPVRRMDWRPVHRDQDRCRFAR